VCDALRSWGSNLSLACPSTKELFQIIPMHMMNREIIPAGKSGFDSVLYKLTVANTLIGTIKVVSCAV